LDVNVNREYVDCKFITYSSEVRCTSNNIYRIAKGDDDGGGGGALLGVQKERVGQDGAGGASNLGIYLS
jgi:hypothetical protein